MNNKKINPKIRNTVLQYVEAIILFDSYAKETKYEDSDINIDIVIDKFKDNIIEEEVEFTNIGTHNVKAPGSKICEIAP